MGGSLHEEGEQPNESDDFRQTNIIYVTSSAARRVPKILLPSEAGLRFDFSISKHECNISDFSILTDLLFAWS